MKIQSKENYILVIADELSFNDFYTAFKKENKQFKNKHLFIQFKDNFITNEKEILLFLDLAIKYKENGTTFVVISSDIDIDSLPDELNIVPTLEEAEDVLEMENIERELGF